MESPKKYPPADSRTEQMIKEYAAGEALRAWEYMGSHQEEREGIPGYVFRVWAPHAAKVSVVGDFNGWEAERGPMHLLGGGIWEAFVPGLQRYDIYKYAVEAADGRVLLKADPYAFHAETCLLYTSGAAGPSHRPPAHRPGWRRRWPHTRRG